MNRTKKKKRCYEKNLLKPLVFRGTSIPYFKVVKKIYNSNGELYDLSKYSHKHSNVTEKFFDAKELAYKYFHKVKKSLRGYPALKDAIIVTYIEKYIVEPHFELDYMCYEDILEDVIKWFSYDCNTKEAKRGRREKL